MRRAYIIGGVVGVLILVLLGAWLWVLSFANPLAHRVATSFPWPIACSTRGCITTTQWQAQYVRHTTFNSVAALPAPTPADSLTTLIRQHLVAHASIAKPVSLDDARRYREDILNQKDEGQVRAATGLSIDQYDKAVIVPFLSQEALRQSRHIESTEELFTQLSRERGVGVLPFSFHWEKDQARAVQD